MFDAGNDGRLAELAASELVGSRIWKMFVLCFGLLLVSDATAGPGGFLPTGSMSFARVQHAAVLLSDGRVLVVGGDSPCCPSLTLSSAELYDPRTGTFSLTGNMSSPRDGPTATLLPNGKVLVISGASAEIYDSVTGTLSPTVNLITSRGGHTTTLLQNGRVLVTGGAQTGDPGKLRRLMAAT
jgi:Kelch motif protein